MKLKTLFASAFCLLLAGYGGATTFAADVEQSNGIDVSVETADNGVITLMDGDKEIGVFFPEEVLDEMPQVYSSNIEGRGGLIIGLKINDIIQPLSTKTYQTEYMNANDSISFSLSWTYNSTTAFGVNLPAPYNPVTIATSSQGKYIGSYFTKVTGSISPFIKNNATARATTYSGSIQYNFY